ncbi:MAG: IS110 family transposase [Acidobacteria bacterium]|nr:IS110 family transposase [Acidobacteriota bacterium]
MTETTMTTVGVDIGDRFCQLCVLDETGELSEETRVATTRPGLRRYFERMPRARIALEVGTHSRWISQVLVDLGHDVYVANPRKLRGIYENDKKTDRTDAQWLAEVARFNPKLLSPIQHRSERAQGALERVLARDVLVRARTQLVNHVRSRVKCAGARLKGHAPETFSPGLLDEIPEERRAALRPVLETLEGLNQSIKRCDRDIVQVSEQEFPETKVLRQVKGVGVLTALTFVATIEDPSRFASSRRVASYLGLRPRLDQSGQQDKQLGISKSGNPLLRRLLVISSQWILGPFGVDSDLRDWGLGLAARGGKGAKKRAVVAVARKLSVLLLALWRSGGAYEPRRQKSPVSDESSLKVA